MLAVKKTSPFHQSTLYSMHLITFPTAVNSTINAKDCCKINEHTIR